MRCAFHATILCAGLLIPFSSGRSQDRVFTYTYQTPTLPTGQSEIEVWTTVRAGREEYFRALDQRIEFETGLAKSLQTAFYLNLRSRSLAEPESPGALLSLHSDVELTFSNEWKYKFLDPVADPLGLALYGEYTVGAALFEFEPRLIVDKSFGRSLVALNVAAEFESERDDGGDGTIQTEQSTELHVNLAASTEIAPGLSAGIEVFSRNSVGNNAPRFSALYAGPTLSYASDRFWANITFMPQLTALNGATAGGLALREAERYLTRLLFSYGL
jgi:hypothetical protein